mgnify:CR=1 FL=1|jgi:lysophospholipase L1-like esterase
MSKLKPMIIVLLMLTSALAGCTGTDGVEGIPGTEGESGEQGPPGIQGETGSAGADGQNGANGMDGRDGIDGADGMDVDESRIAQLEAELASKDATIAILLGNISDMEEELEAVDNVIEMYYMMFVQIQNDMNDLESDINCQIRPYAYCAGADLTLADLNGADLFGANLWAADLSNADLRNADLSYAVLNYANLTNANLSDADLSDADLSDVNWDWATCPDGTAAYYHGQTCENNIALYSDWLFIGDSDIEEWDTSQYIDSSNIGDGGSTCNDTLSSIDEVLEQYTPVHVVIVCGENDLWQRTVEDTFEDFQAIVNKIILSGASVTYMGTKAEPATTELHAEYREYDSLIQDSAVNLANNSYAPLNVVDVYQGFEDIGNPNSLYQDDELHLSLDGYEYWNQWLVQISNDSDCIIWQSQECRVSIE